MSSNRGESSLAGEVLVELILQVDEGVVSGLVEGDSPEDGSYHMGPDLEHAGVQDELLHHLGLGQTVAGGGHLALEDQQRSHQSLQAQQIVSINTI